MPLVSLAGPYSDWTAASAKGASIRVLADAGSSVVLSSGTSGAESRLVRTLDAKELRGKRLEVTASIRGQGEGAAGLRIVAFRPKSSPNLWDEDNVTSALVDSWTEQTVLVDIPSDATTVEVSFVANGRGTATFRDAVATLSESPKVVARRLTSSEHRRIAALARLVGYLRFFHPSDQAATANWQQLEVEAVGRILNAESDSAAVDVLRWLTNSVAPTAALYEKAPPSMLPPPPANGQRLTRWVRVGLGPSLPFLAMRDGMDEPTFVGTSFFATWSGADCGRARLHTELASIGPDANVTVVLAPTAGIDNPGLVTEVLKAAGASDLDTVVPSEARAIGYGIQIGGSGDVQINRLSLKCNEKTVSEILPGAAIRPTGIGSHLYHVDATSRCGAKTCIAVTRRRPTEVDPGRDVIDVDVGLGQRLRLPLVVWTDGRKTYPAVSTPTVRPSWAPGELPVRLTAILDVWVTARWFFPYFEDIGLSWDDVLAPALDSAALSTSPEALVQNISALLARLNDDHARIANRSYLDGMLPFLLRRFGDRLFVVAGVGGYEHVLPPGAEVVSVDSVPVAKALDLADLTTSAATPAWKESETAFAVGYGRRGTLVRLGAKRPDGSSAEVTVPRVDFGEYVDIVREHHPDSGAELASGVFYVDMDSLDIKTWDSLLPNLAHARGIIFDLRGYVTGAGFDAVGHFIDTEVIGPIMDSPVIVPRGQTVFERHQDSIVPRAPRLTAKAVFLVDGRTASAPETLLQYVAYHKIGIVVGEPSGGTNGNRVSFDSIYGLEIRFTGIRALNPDGSRFHGRGINPDILVLPSVQGIASGRDEILEAALRTIPKL